MTQSPSTHGRFFSLNCRVRSLSIQDGNSDDGMGSYDVTYGNEDDDVEEEEDERLIVETNGYRCGMLLLLTLVKPVVLTVALVVKVKRKNDTAVLVVPVVGCRFLQLDNKIFIGIVLL
jgi:hypothetical protein